MTGTRGVEFWLEKQSGRWVTHDLCPTPAAKLNYMNLIRFPHPASDVLVSFWAMSLTNNRSLPTWSCGWQTRAAVNRRSPNAGAIAGRLFDHAKRLDCGGFSTALVFDRAMVCQRHNPSIVYHLD